MAVKASCPGVSRKVILRPVEHDAVRADVLRDAARLAFDDVGLADIVQQRRLAVVDVSHDGHDRRARHEGCLVVDFVVGDRLLDVGRYELDLISELFGHDHHRLGVETLVDRNHQAQVHAGRNHLVDRNVHHRRQLADGDELGHFEDRTLLLLALHLLVQAFGHQLAFLLAVLRRPSIWHPSRSGVPAYPSPALLPPRRSLRDARRVSPHGRPSSCCGHRPDAADRRPCRRHCRRPANRRRYRLRGPQAARG